eukprot:GILI01024444.1.p1 GENE.GILI01024444.1~~GILI01024444.1.p1  ORF type:complete len:327 (-),score=25.93 GILI01024444.1:135-1115(-)
MAPTDPSGSSSTKGGVKPTAVQHTIATQGAAAVSTIVLYPLDVVKLRFMSQDGTEARKHNNKYYTSTVYTMRDIFKDEGIGALYKGCHVAVSGSIIAWGAYMYLYRVLTMLFVQPNHTDHEGNNTRDFAARSVVSIFASTTSSVLTTPIFLVKTRMQVEDRSKAAGQQYYTTFRSSFHRIVTTTGYLSLWRGLSAQLLLGVPNALNFPMYDTIKAWRLRQTHTDFLTNNEVLACSTVTKMLLMTMTHPLFVLKTRLQDHRSHLGEVKYQSLWSSFVTVYKRERLIGFYRGTVPSVMQAVPRSVLHTFVYEKLLQAQVKADGYLYRK